MVPTWALVNSLPSAGKVPDPQRTLSKTTTAKQREATTHSQLQATPPSAHIYGNTSMPKYTEDTFVISFSAKDNQRVKKF